MNYIYIGSVSNPLFSFDDDQIMSITNEMAVSVIADELTADVFEAEIVFNDENGALRNLPYATKIYYYQDTDEVASFYFTSVKRIGKELYEIRATSFVGLFEDEPYYGGIFFGMSFENVVRRIVCTKGLEEYIQYKNATCGADSGSWYGVLTSADGYETGSTTKCKVHIRFKPIKSTVHLFGQTGYTAYYTTGGGTSQFYLYVQRPGVSGNYRVGSFHYNAIIDLIIEPAIGKITVLETYNGTTTTTESTFTAVTTGASIRLSSALCQLKSGGGIDSSNSGKVGFEFYRVWDEGGNLIINDVPIVDVDDGKVYIRNLVTKYTSSEITPSSVVSSDISVDTNPSNPDIARISATTLDIMDSITYGTGIDAFPVYGWIANGTKRQALYQLMFANCVNLIHNNSGKFIFDTLSNDIEDSISRDSIFDQGSVDFQEAVKSIELTVHSYDSYQASTEIFNNENQIVPAEEYVVEFNNAPIYGTPVAASGDIQILAYNCNTALVTGKGSITGTPYIHGKTVHPEILSDDYRGKTVAVSDATMVTYLNYINVLTRLKAYYQTAFEIEANMIYNNTAAGDPLEKTGKKYQFTDVFDDSRSGFLSRLSLRISSFVKAVCRFLCGYIVPDATGGYTHYEILTGSGTWTVPDGVDSFRAVLIGGGTGGYSGYSGEDGDQPTVDEERSTVMAHGGMYGASGTPGKVYEIEVTSPAASYSYSCGAGGLGGTHADRSDKVTSNAGLAGGATTFGSDSSASGTIYNNGIFNRLTGEKYAFIPNVWSDASGKGGNGGYAIYLGNHKWQKVGATSAYNALPNVAVNTFPGGTNGQDDTSYSVVTGYVTLAVGGSGGGGAIYDRTIVSTAQNGTSAMWTGYQEESGDGGIGSPVNSTYEDYAPPVQGYGCGGLGGVGGGGGGAAGCFNQEYRASQPQRTFVVGTAGQGGAGSDGGAGGDGCVIVYY